MDEIKVYAPGTRVYYMNGGEIFPLFNIETPRILRGEVVRWGAESDGGPTVVYQIKTEEITRRANANVVSDTVVGLFQKLIDELHGRGGYDDAVVEWARVKAAIATLEDCGVPVRGEVKA